MNSNYKNGSYQYHILHPIWFHTFGNHNIVSMNYITALAFPLTLAF